MNQQHQSAPLNSDRSAADAVMTGEPFRTTPFVWSKRREPYHVPSCKSVTAMRERNRVEGTLKEAADERRRPCKVCKPPLPGDAQAERERGHVE